MAAQRAPTARRADGQGYRPTPPVPSRCSFPGSVDAEGTPPNRSLRLVLAVALVVFLALNLYTRSWVYAGMAALWLALLALREVLQRRDPPE